MGAKRGVASQWRNRLPPNRDSRFFVCSTIKGGEAIDTSTESQPVRGDKPARIVIADDHFVVRSGLRLVLATQPDLQVVGEAASGRGALDLCRALRPDLVLMDVDMPEMDGLEAIRRIRQHEQAQGQGRAPIVVVSANTSAEDVRACMAAGADGHLAKPVLRMDVLGVVTEFLAKRD